MAVYRSDGCYPIGLTVGVIQVNTVAGLMMVAVGCMVMGLSWLVFLHWKLDPAKAIHTTATLVGFREIMYRKYGSACTPECIYEDSEENLPGSVPIVDVEIDGKIQRLATEAHYPALLQDDIGRPIKVCWQRKHRIEILVDNNELIWHYLSMHAGLFAVFAAIGLALVLFGVSITV